MNVGLNSKRNIPLITNSFGTNDTAYLNLDKNNANLIINIPTITRDEGIENKIGDIILTYSYLNRDTGVTKGIKINIMKYIVNITKNVSNIIESITIGNGDFTNTTYTKEEDSLLLRNPDTDSFIEVEYNYDSNNIPVLGNKIKLYDNVGNYYQFNYTNDVTSLNPSLLHKIDFIDDDNIEFDLDDVRQKYIRYKEYTIIISLNNLLEINNICFKKNNTIYSKCDLLYSNGYLTHIYKYIWFTDDLGQSIDGMIDHKSYVFNNSNYVKVKSEVSGHYTKYYLNNDKVTSFINCFEENEMSGQTTSINYYSSYTKVSNYKGQETKYYIRDNKVVCIKFYDGKVTTINYNKQGRIEEKLDILDISKEESEKRGNLFPNGYEFEPGSYTVENVLNQSFVEKMVELDNTNALSVYNNSGSTDMIIKFEIDNIYVRRNEGLTFIANCTKLDSKSYSPLKFEICLYDKNRPNPLFYSQNLSVEANDIYGEKITVSKLFIAYDTYNTAIIKIRVPLNEARYIISHIQLYKEFLGSLNEYNEFGCLVKSWNGNNVTLRSFIKEDKRLLQTSENNDNISYIINYNNKGKPTEILSNDGTIIKNEYDVNGNIKHQVVMNKEGKYIENSKTYTTDGLKILTETNNEDLMVSYEHDYDNRKIKKVLHSNGLTEDFEYDDKLYVNKRKLSGDNVNIEEEYSYDSKNRLCRIKLNNEYSYMFNYDSYGNVVDTKLFKNNILTELEKNTYEYDGSVYTNNLETKRIGNIDGQNNKRKYIYNNDGNLEKVYCDGLNEDVLLYEFEYDSLNNVIKIINYENDEVINYDYDKYNNLVKEEHIKAGLTIITHYNYDLKGNLLIRNEQAEDSHLNYYVYNNVGKKHNTPVKIYNYFKGKSDLYSCFLLSKDSDGSVKADLSNSTSIIQHYDKLKKPAHTLLDHSMTKSFSLSYNEDKKLIYKTSLNKTIGNTFAFWFKASTSNVGKTIFSICDLTLNSSGEEVKVTQYDLALSSNKKIKFYGSTEETDNSLNLNEWNFIAFRISQMSNSTMCDVFLNGVKSTLTTTKVLMEDNQAICYGNYLSNTTSSYGVIGDITCLFMTKKLLTDDEIQEIYSLTSENYINYITAHNDSFNTHYITNRYEKVGNYKVVPLNNSFESLDNSLKYNFTKNEMFNENLNDVFIYEKDHFNNYVYCNNGHKLIYNVPYTATMLAGVKALSNNVSSKQTIIEFGNSINGLIGLFIDVDSKLKCFINDTIINTNINITANTANKYYLSYYLSDMNPQTRKFVYRIKVVFNDNIIFDQFYESSSELVIEKVSVGSAVYSYSNDRFYGLMSMLFINTSTSSLDNVLDLDNKDTICSSLNNLGQLIERQVVNGDQNIVKQKVVYYSDVDNNPSKCYNKISKDEFYTASLNSPFREITYQTDPNTGNITRRVLRDSIGNLNDTVYRYDKFGQLYQEDKTNDNLTIEYLYDKNGNIRSKEEFNANTNISLNKIEFDYDSNTPNKLTKFTKNGYTTLITYYNDVSGMPLNFKNFENNELICSFEWNFRKLTKYSFNSNKYVDYSYSFNGLRTNKTTVDENIGSNIVHRYRYSGNRLIEEYINDEAKGESYKLNYYYDQFGILYGFKYNNTMYYYLRDSLQTIIGILNSSKELVCEYTYDAYGNHKVLNSSRTIETSNSFIGNINPFRYKGYYYDAETNLFLVSSRYYSPELCRWISPDDIEYLEPESINGLNLYAYCGNDPINNYDPTGHFSLPNWAKWVIGGVAFAGAVALTALTGGALAPMFIQFGASIVLGGLIQGTVNAIQGENFWEGFADGAASGALTGGVLALGQSIFRVIKVANYASKGLTIGKKGTFEQVGQMTGTAHYGGLKSHGLLSKVFGRKFADKVGWIQNKSIVQGVMKFKGVIYDCGGQLTGIYAKEIALTKGYQYFVNIWLL